MAFYNAIVVGAGVEGSATAYYLAKKGQKTLLLEQSMWHVGHDGSHYIDEITNALDKYQVPYERLNREQLRNKYAINLPPDASGVLDPSGGILKADKAVQAFQKQFMKFGGDLHDGEAVTGIEPGTIVRIHTKKGMYRTRNLILCLGSWAGSFLSKHINVRFPFKPIRITVCYFEEKNEGQYSINRFPTFSFKRSVPYDMYYGLPAYEYPGLLKIFLHYGPETDPDRRDENPDSSAQTISCNFVKNFFPEIMPKPVVIETCIYTMTPDEHFVLDRHPKWENIIIGAGFSGHGFKLAPVVGKILGDLAMKVQNSYDLTPFKLDRFNRKSAL